MTPKPEVGGAEVDLFLEDQQSLPVYTAHRPSQRGGLCTESGLLLGFVGPVGISQVEVLKLKSRV